MKPEDFEYRLEQIPFREIPHEWKEEILHAATRQAPIPRRPAETRPLQPLLHRIFWPHPRAWAALAAVWMLIGFLNFSGPQQADLYAGPPPSNPRTPEELIAEIHALQAHYHFLLSEQNHYIPVPKTKL